MKIAGDYFILIEISGQKKKHVDYLFLAFFSRDLPILLMEKENQRIFNFILNVTKSVLAGIIRP